MSLVLCNNSGGAATYRLHLVPNGQTAGAGNAIYGYDFSLTPNTPMPIPLNDWMEAGDTIQGFASTGNVALAIFGIEEA